MEKQIEISFFYTSPQTPGKAKGKFYLEPVVGAHIQDLNDGGKIFQLIQKAYDERSDKTEITDVVVYFEKSMYWMGEIKNGKILPLAQVRKD